MLTFFHLILLPLLLANGEQQNAQSLRQATFEKILFVSKMFQEPKNALLKQLNISFDSQLVTNKEESLTSSKGKNNFAPLSSEILKIYGHVPIGAQKAFFSNHTPTYALKDFPLNVDEFYIFREKTQKLLEIKWPNKTKNSKISLIGSRTYDVDGETLTYQFYLAKLATGEVSPLIYCKNNSKENRFSFLVSPGHSNSPLLDIISNSDSYQQAIGTKLCQLGYPVVATEKIDSGFNSVKHHMNGHGHGNDENKIGPLLLATSNPLAARQLELSKIGTTILKQKHSDKSIISVGTALGGWISIHAAIVDKRIRAAIVYPGNNTLFEGHADKFTGMKDYSQLFSGMINHGDRTLMILALAQTHGLVLGHGGENESKDAQLGWKHTNKIIKQQFSTLGRSECLIFDIHNEGHKYPQNAAQRISTHAENLREKKCI